MSAALDPESAYEQAQAEAADLAYEQHDDKHGTAASDLDRAVFWARLAGKAVREVATLETELAAANARADEAVTHSRNDYHKLCAEVVERRKDYDRDSRIIESLRRDYADLREQLAEMRAGEAWRDERIAKLSDERDALLARLEGGGR